jgi:hypothetical protein
MLPTSLEPLKDLKKNYIIQRPSSSEKKIYSNLITLKDQHITQKNYIKIKILKKCKTERTDGLIL